MLNSDVLEVAIGLVFIYLLLSLIATSAREGLEGLLKTRSKGLEAGLIELFDARNQPQLLQQFYAHPLINALYRGDYAPPQNLTAASPPAGAGYAKMRKAVVRNLPSYIPASSFALAVLDMAAGDAPSSPPGSSPPGSTLTMAELQAAVATLPGSFGDAMRLAARTCQSLDEVRTYLEDWFNAAMDRVSGVYRRYTQGILLVFSVAVCILLNVNTLVIAQALSQSQALRAAVAADAEGASKNNDFVNAITNDATASNAINTQVGQIERVQGLPIGWGADALSRMQRLTHIERLCLSRECFVFPGWQAALGVLELVAGWLITAFAIMLGAPFWFDVLNKIMVVRSTVKPAEKSGDEASKDK